MRNVIKIGDKYGHLTVVEKSKPHYSPSGEYFSTYLCKCDCGNMHVVQGYMLTRGQVTSCGCARKGIYRKAYWDKKKYPRTYTLWLRMKNKYGKELMCNQWFNDFDSFNQWYMEQPNCVRGQIIRKNEFRKFSPENCFLKIPISITYLGETHTLKEWSDKLGINYNTIRKRYYDKFSVEDILSTNDLRNERKMTK